MNTVEAIKNRHSVRNYIDRQIDKNINLVYLFLIGLIAICLFLIFKLRFKRFAKKK